MSSAPAVKFCQSFKKYTSEFKPEIVAFVKEWTRGKAGVDFYEDRSLIKVTSDEATIQALRTDVTAKFPEWKPVGIEGADDKKKK
jgi:hypothetical protein